MGGCPTSEALAEYLEGGLPPERRLRVEEHLAGCPDCCTSFAQASLFMHEEHEEERVAAWWAREYAPAGGVAAALSLLVAATAAMMWTQLGAATKPAAEAMRRERSMAVAVAMDTTGPRLTAGRRWATLAPAAVPRELRRGYVEAAAPDAADSAVAALLRAVATEPESAELQSDLGAALLARARQGGTGDDSAAALESIESALAAAPRLPEALFDHALALEQLHLPQSTQAAWRVYLDVDPTSPWADEARRHLLAGDAPSSSSTARSGADAAADGDRIRAELAAAGASGDNVHLAELVKTFRGMARQTVPEDLLPGWAGAVLGGDDAEAERQLSAAAAVAAEWEAQTTDSSLRLAVADVERAEGERRGAMARGYVALGEAIRELDAFRVPEARSAAERALRELPADGVAALWARVVRLGCLAYQDGDVQDEAASISAHPKLGADAATRARLELIVGYRQAVHGDMAAAISPYLQALAAYEQLGDRDSLAWMQHLLGEVYGYMGQSGRAWGHYLPAIAAAPVLIDRDRAFSVLLGAAMVALLEGRPRTAAAILDEVLAGPLTAPDQQAQAYLWRCRIRIAVGDSIAARADLQRAEAWAARSSAVYRQQLSGDLQAAAGMLAPQPAQAVAAFSRALVSIERSGKTFRMPGLLLERARAYRRIGDVAAADADLRRGLELIDAQSPSVRGEALATARLEGPERLADQRIDLALAAGRGERAFALAEEQRARTLRGLGREASRVDSLAELQRRMDHGTTLLFYAVLEDRVVLWRISSAGVTLIPLQVRPVEIEHWVHALRTDLAAGAWNEGTRRIARNLYAALLAPARLDDDNLVVVPDKDLHSLPFAALVDPATGRYVIEERELAIAPSAALYLRGRDRWRELAQAPPQSAVVVGDPSVDPVVFPDLLPLPGARAEARQVAALYPRHELFVGSAATRAGVLAAADRGEVLHFGGHALLNAIAPEESSLPLAAAATVSDDALAGADIGALHLARIRTVVLSTCDSAAGARPPGEGPISLARAFLHAGAPTVVASLWAVPDQPTAPLIARVHQHLRAGEKAASALRAAQLDALRSRQPSLRSPAVWAAFESFGG
ncbi:MAG TPA: CHAT domain-containing protein [Thermoanaerobaculia bacterium]|jgi:CHAT domain-containing protein|nr:CHAT domain-containing protein [Thermoanaerobaculia bacterium]